MLYTYQDYLGSVIAITDENGDLKQELSGVYPDYVGNAWGRPRRPDNHSYQNVETPILDRGYTMHEHLFAFELIHMNGRLYDPQVGRMLSLDNHVQSPGNGQNYNRYSYVLNNPLKYTDPSGEFAIGDSWLIGLVDGFFSKGENFGDRFTNGWREANHRAGNDAKIWGGLFVTDQNKSFGGQVLEFVSRTTWQLPQTIIGLGYSHTTNTVYGQVNSVNYFGGATILDVDDLIWDGDQASGVTLGSYILGEGISSNPFETNPGTNTISRGARLLRHEYGHYIQSQRNGWTYLPKYGIPSASGAEWTEIDAEYRSDKYFEKHYGKDPIYYGLRGSGRLVPTTVFDSYSEDYKPVNAKWWEHVTVIGGTYFGGVSGFFIGAGTVGVLNLNKVR